MELKIDEGSRRVIVSPPSKPKKITGTRFAAILGSNRWSTPFNAWCAITRTYEEPFEGSIYTEAGKVIEPKIDQYLRDRFFMDDLKTPEDVFGVDFFKKTWGDFYRDEPVFGGMWDAIGDDYVVEIKTTKRVEDWKKEPPLYYMLQGALYAWLKGFDRVIMVCAFLTDHDYEFPEKFEPSIDNTIIHEFSIEERFPTFVEDYVDPAREWWKRHIETGESPEYDPKMDAPILKALRTNVISENNTDDKSIADLVKEFESVSDDLTRMKERYGINRLEILQSELKDKIKDVLTGSFRPSDKSATYTSDRSVYTVTKKAGSESVDTKRLKKERPEVFEEFKKIGKPTYSLTTAVNTK